MNKIKGIIVALFAVIVIGTTTTYAVSDNLNITNNNHAQSWNIQYENIVNIAGNVNAFLDADNMVQFSCELNVPGDKCMFTVDMINKGIIDAEIEEMDLNKLTSNQEKFLNYKVSYIDDTNIAKGDILKSGESKTIKVLIEYKQDIEANDLNNENEKIDFYFNINVVDSNMKNYR